MFQKQLVESRGGQEGRQWTWAPGATLVAHRATKYTTLNEHQTSAGLPWPLPQNFNPAMTQEPQIKTQYWGLSSFPMTPVWEAEPN